jgi:wyosine [tRNA(Phe)-imidazoG37] synthetase (radical SAM superfamily)
MSILFDDIVFGPVRSRRLGLSLGINLLPQDKKVCTFNCIYCECGWTQSTFGDKIQFHGKNDIMNVLEIRFMDLLTRAVIPDSLTFAGNGEPTIHPEFAAIIDDTLELRDHFFPKARVAVLSNSTTLGIETVFNALMKVDNVMKLDTGSEEMFRLINKPMIKVTLEEIVSNLMRFKGKLTIQTLLLKGTLNGKVFDNTSGIELEKYLGHLKLIKPALVMLYPIDRPSPSGNIDKTSPEIIENIAGQVRGLGIEVKVYA